jgi:hypothetical protein
MKSVDEVVDNLLDVVSKSRIQRGILHICVVFSVFFFVTCFVLMSKTGSTIYVLGSLFFGIWILHYILTKIKKSGLFLKEFPEAELLLTYTCVVLSFFYGVWLYV